MDGRKKQETEKKAGNSRGGGGGGGIKSSNNNSIRNDRNDRAECVKIPATTTRRKREEGNKTWERDKEKRKVEGRMTNRKRMKKKDK